jgi:predicted phosphoribosyltransferase
MIHNDQELATTQERIVRFYDLLAQMRVTAKPEEFSAVASGYRAEIALMQNEVLEYLTRHASQPVPAEAA